MGQRNGSSRTGTAKDGRKRHIAVDTLGLLIRVLVTAASVQDRDAARPLLAKLTHACHRVRLVWVRDTLRITVQIVKPS